MWISLTTYQQKFGKVIFHSWREKYNPWKFPWYQTIMQNLISKIHIPFASVGFLLHRLFKICKAWFASPLWNWLRKQIVNKHSGRESLNRPSTLLESGGHPLFNSLEITWGRNMKTQPCYVILGDKMFELQKTAKSYLYTDLWILNVTICDLKKLVFLLNK